MESPVLQAKTLLRSLNETRRSEENLADELLLFLYRLRDTHRIIRSSHPLVQGKSFVVLNEVIYRLESDPDTALSDGEISGTLRSVLEGIVKGTILLGPLS